MSGGHGRIANVGAAVLIGGASTRMGADKAQLPFAGAPAATRASRLLASLFGDVALVGAAPPGDAIGRSVDDGTGERCALRGVAAALAAASTDRVLVVATDLVLLTPELVLGLVAWPEADVVLPRIDGLIEPLCALWRRAPVLERARTQLAAERFALHALVAQLDARFVEGDDLRALDPDGTALANANTPEEWSRLEAIALGGGGR